MSDEDLDAEQINEITAFVDIEAPPPREQPTAHILFGTNQVKPTDIAAERYHNGLAPLLIATGGINRHSGTIEGWELYKLLTERDVPETAIRYENRAQNTWQNVEYSLPFLRGALESGLRVTVVSKWYHRRTIHALKTLLPDIGPFYALSWEPVYAGKTVTRSDWPLVPDGKRRVIREWEEVSCRVADGSFEAADLYNGAWH